MLAMSGAPGYEQKELRSNGEHVSAVLRMARAELLYLGHGESSRCREGGVGECRENLYDR